MSKHNAAYKFLRHWGKFSHIVKASPRTAERVITARMWLYKYNFYYCYSFSCFVTKPVCTVRSFQYLAQHHPPPQLEDHPLSAVRDCLFTIFAANLHIGGRSSIRNLRTRHVEETQNNLSHTYIPTYLFHYCYYVTTIIIVTFTFLEVSV